MNGTPKGTLEELEVVTSGLSRRTTRSRLSRCAALRRKPLDKFTIEDLRIMIGQNDFYRSDFLGV